MIRPKLISEGQLINAFESELSSQYTAELAVLQLLRHYDFDLDELRCLLLSLCSSLKLTFSKLIFV
jgi:hypothetical protein